MRSNFSLIAVLLASAAATPSLASDENRDADASVTDAGSQPDPSPAPAAKTFTTGVAKGRDLLDSAISASVIDEAALAELSVSSIAGILQNIPGIRSETSDIDGFSAITIRGLPLAAEGSKFLQLQEDGLPVLEFGDIQFASIDQFLRADLTLSQVQAIRGGSASTFASNSPGGLINFISRTGETEGGMLQVSSGVGHDLKRIDFAYGSPLGDGWRFHVGGFYRSGEGPREIGYTGFKGGQIKANVTKEFERGYIRFYAKYLDDKQPNYGYAPARITGTDGDPQIAFLPGFDVHENAISSPLVAAYPDTDRNNNRRIFDVTDGISAKVTSFGFEAQFEILGFTVNNRFRYSDVSGGYHDILPDFTGPAAALASFGDPGSQLRYAAGPKNGRTVLADQILALAARNNADLEGLDNVTNDLRASRVWDAGDGKLTTTLGLYNSSQQIQMFWNFASTLQDIAGGGRSAPVDLFAGNGQRLSDGGVLGYGFLVGPLDLYHTLYDIEVETLAPYGSVNYQIGKLAIGASIRWDKGSVTGNVFSAGFGNGRVGIVPFDVNGDTQITPAEARVAVLPLSRPVAADYDYDYLSYSAGVNYRFADSVSAFARYSRGGRASAENSVGASSLNPLTGTPTDRSQLVSVVKQAEGGIKFRKNGITAFLTGFWASTDERNFQVGSNAAGETTVDPVDRTYSAKGLEFEGEWVRGAFKLVAGATYTDATIDKDKINPAIDDNNPRHIPEFSFFLRPEARFGKVTFGGVINGTTESFAQDTNQLIQPGYVIVSPFVQVRPAEGLTLAVNAFNVFDELAVVSTGAATIPPGGIANLQVMNGRTVTASLRYSF